MDEGEVAGIFTEAAMHTPIEVTERAMDSFAALGADCTIALGGGFLDRGQDRLHGANAQRVGEEGGGGQ